MPRKIQFYVCFMGLIFSLISCQKEEPFTSDSLVIWVNSSKRQCNTPSMDFNCLFISESESFEDATWEKQVRQISGFDFKEGFIYQLRVQEMASSSNNHNLTNEKEYRLIETLHHEFDESIKFSGMWNLESLHGYTNPPTKRFIFDPFYRVLYGTYNCNAISYKANDVTKSSIVFKQFEISEKVCDPDQDIHLPDFEELLHGQLLQIRKYHLNGGNLNLMDESGKTQIMLQKTNMNPKDSKIP
jgi:hypothetical protein